jgi:hypothetical protein
MVVSCVFFLGGDKGNHQVQNFGGKIWGDGAHLPSNHTTTSSPEMWWHK